MSVSEFEFRIRRSDIYTVVPTEAKRNYSDEPRRKNLAGFLSARISSYHRGMKLNSLDIPESTPDAP